MPNLNVTYADMNDAATKLRSGKDEIDQRLQQMKAMIDNLVASGYVTDQSSPAFQNAYQEFNDGATKTIEGLTGISTYLDKAAQALQDTDSQLANALKG